MQGLNLIALSIPVFFALIGVELLVARVRGEKLYRFNDSINDLACGILQQALGVFTKVVVFGGYVLLYETGHLFDFSSESVWVWVFCFLGVDFLYYWFVPRRVPAESAAAGRTSTMARSELLFLYRHRPKSATFIAHELFCSQVGILEDENLGCRRKSHMRWTRQIHLTPKVQDSIIGRTFLKTPQPVPSAWGCQQQGREASRATGVG